MYQGYSVFFLLFLICFKSSAQVVGSIKSVSTDRISFSVMDSTLLEADIIQTLDAKASCSFTVLKIKQDNGVAKINQCIRLKTVVPGMLLKRELEDREGEAKEGIAKPTKAPSQESRLKSHRFVSLNDLIYLPEAGHFFGKTSFRISKFEASTQVNANSTNLKNENNLLKQIIFYNSSEWLNLGISVPYSMKFQTTTSNTNSTTIEDRNNSFTGSSLIVSGRFQTFDSRARANISLDYAPKEWGSIDNNIFSILAESSFLFQLIDILVSSRYSIHSSTDLFKSFETFESSFLAQYKFSQFFFIRPGLKYKTYTNVLERKDLSFGFSIKNVIGFTLGFGGEFPNKHLSWLINYSYLSGNIDFFTPAASNTGPYNENEANITLLYSF